MQHKRAASGCYEGEARLHQPCIRRHLSSAVYRVIRTKWRHNRVHYALHYKPESTCSRSGLQQVSTSDLRSICFRHEMPKKSSAEKKSYINLSVRANVKKKKKTQAKEDLNTAVRSLSRIFGPDYYEYYIDYCVPNIDTASNRRTSLPLRNHRKRTR